MGLGDLLFQFVFEGEKENIILSSFTNPSTTVKNNYYNFPTPVWRDAMCNLINKIVITAILEEN
ncbi:hypothetical protein ACQKP0_24220 [Heyndrickxia sp. NPDC080065]|uniref:hypothetical protein n=1 Tax=Heyndrickxia sp. NPDC080065 TaxID=3390568 RepID=UPI003D033F41